MHKEITDEILLKASRGDLDSFEIIYKACSSFVYNIAYRVLNNREEAQELTQEVFLTVFDKLKEFRFQSAFKTWIYRVTVNSAINRSKKISRERNSFVEFDDRWMVDASKDNSQEDENAVNTSTIEKLLNVLNPQQRACIVLRSMQGLSYQEIAQTLGVNINTVRSRLKRARETMMSFRKEVMNHDM